MQWATVSPGTEHHSPVLRLAARFNISSRHSLNGVRVQHLNLSEYTVEGTAVKLNTSYLLKNGSTKSKIFTSLIDDSTMNKTDNQCTRLRCLDVLTEGVISRT